jgi:hypothetical protein
LTGKLTDPRIQGYQDEPVFLWVHWPGGTLTGKLTDPQIQVYQDGPVFPVGTLARSDIHR